MVMSATVGINMPSDFPTLPHNNVNVRLGSYQQRPLWSEYAAGWNAVALRFFSAAKADDVFTASITKTGGGMPPPDERQIQEEALFVFFVAGLSAIESLAYALYAMGAMLQPGHFPMSLPGHFRAIEPKLTRQKFAAHFAGESVEAEFSKFVGDDIYAKWGLIRNVLAHRAAPARQQQMTLNASTGGGPGSARTGTTEWQVIGGLTLDGQTTRDRRAWLASQLTACVQATDAFVTRLFP